MSPKPIYKVIFANQGKVYEIYASAVSQGGLFGFVEVEEILFGEKSAVVVDPSEEALKVEFKGVQRTFIPMHSILRIDEVDKQGTGRIRTDEDGTSNVAPFPMTVAPPQTEK